MFGVTTPCVQHASKLLEAAGYEVITFHATGSGGRAMESLIAEGLVAGVLDITTTELADELVGGILSAGPDRLTAAARAGIPQVVSVGALDMVNFGPRDTVPPHFAGRKFHIHNPTVTLMRTTAAENAELGEELARKVSASSAPSAIVLPLRGVSAIDRAGQPFDDALARNALFAAIRAHRSNLELIECDAHINDATFAAAAAEKLLALLASGGRKSPESVFHAHRTGAASPGGANAPSFRDCDRFWFFTWTTYGTWLPGDERGFVSNVTDPATGKTVIHNRPDTPYDADDPALRERSIANLKCQPIHLLPAQADELLKQVQETSAKRGWLLLAAAVMHNHAHLVVGVPGDPDPAEMLRDYKAYGSRCLNRRWSKPVSETWWTESGSKRKLPRDENVAAAVEYVRNQPNPLIVWIHPSFHGERGT